VLRERSVILQGHDATAYETFVPEHLFTQYQGGASLVGLLAALVVAGIFSAPQFAVWIDWDRE
jgi:hypothetical protein